MSGPGLSTGHSTVKKVGKTPALLEFPLQRETENKPGSNKVVREGSGQGQESRVMPANGRLVRAKLARAAIQKASSAEGAQVAKPGR